MRTVLRWFAARPLRLLGGFLVFISTGLLVFLVLLDIAVGMGNPYIGILAYMVLPGVLILGLVLVPIDAWVQRRRVARGKPTYPVVDLTDPTQRKIAGFFAVASVVILVVTTVVLYKSVEFMDSVTFCGKVCHRVMIPEYTAYLRSSHASVDCVKCHIGPGAPWYVRSKLSGLPQVWHYLRGDYRRPLETPLRALRPSREICENCHWTERFYGSMLSTKISHAQDRQNTRRVRSMLLRVGSGGVPGSGIHGHMASTIYYIPARWDRREIAWLRVRKPDGSVREYVNPTYQARLASIRQTEEQRLMDCIDCHNRAAHDFLPFERLLDEAINRGQVDASLPFIKREAMKAVGEVKDIPTAAQQAGVLKRIRDIRLFYEKEFPEIARNRRAQLRRSIDTIEQIYLASGFAHMRVGPETYPNWATHVGCFRCHGVMREVGASSPRYISANCELCHSQQIEGAPTELLARF